MKDQPTRYDPDEKVYAAIGRVAASSARAERSLQHLLDQLIGGDQAWILFQGQQVNWLIDSTRAVLTQIDGYSTWAPLVGEIEETLTKCRKFNTLRNTVIHATWHTDCFFVEDCEAGGILRRLEDEQTFHFLKSQRAKGLSEQRFTLRELDKISEELLDVDVRITRILGRYNDAVQERVRSHFPSS